MKFIIRIHLLLSAVVLLLVGNALTELAREALEDARVISISQTSFDYVVKISRGIST